jgi:hypothetical protein
MTLLESKGHKYIGQEYVGPIYTHKQEHVMISAIKNMLKDQLVGWGKELGFDVLNREQSIDFLSDCLVSAHPGDQITLPDVYDFTDRSKRIFTATSAVTEPIYVWHYEADQKKPVCYIVGHCSPKARSYAWTGRKIASCFVTLQV